MSDTMMIVLSNNYYDPVKILKMVKDGSMDLKVHNHDYIYTTTLKNGESLTATIQNVTFDPRNSAYIDRYIVSVFENPYFVHGAIKIYHFDTEILKSPYELNVHTHINDIDRSVRIPYKIGQTMGELFAKLPLLVDYIPEEDLEYYQFVYGRRKVVPMDSVVAAQTWVDLEEIGYSIE